MEHSILQSHFEHLQRVANEPSNLMTARTLAQVDIPQTQEPQEP